MRVSGSRSAACTGTMLGRGLRQGCGTLQPITGGAWDRHCSKAMPLTRSWGPSPVVLRRSEKPEGAGGEGSPPAPRLGCLKHRFCPGAWHHWARCSEVPRGRSSAPTREVGAPRSNHGAGDTPACPEGRAGHPAWGAEPSRFATSEHHHWHLAGQVSSGSALQLPLERVIYRKPGNLLSSRG